MIGFLTELFSYDFIRRAVFVGVLVSLCASLLGVTLVLKRYSMIGDGLSHVGFGAACIAMALNVAPLKISIPVVVVAAFFLLRISESGKIKGDSAIALISSAAISTGVIAASLSSGLNTDVSDYMFGSIMTLDNTDVKLSILVAIIVPAMFIVFYNRIFSVTFDEGFAKATGMKTGILNTVIALLTAITVVIGMKIMGAMLISSLIIFPAITSMRLFKSFKAVSVFSAVISVFCFLAGIVISFRLSLPAGASVVAVNAVALLLAVSIRGITTLNARGRGRKVAKKG